MCGVARLAKEAGFQISGSDRPLHPPMDEQVRRLDAPIFTGYDADVAARPADCYVVGNAISRGNPLMESILSHRRPHISAPQWLGENILQNRKVLVVAGSHGKTTVSSLLAWMLERAGFRPGFLIGGAPQNFSESARLGGGEWFVIEGDEYDTAFFDKRPKFLHYCPTVAALNNLEFDHADIYRNADEIVRQFHYLLRTIPAEGKIIFRADDSNLQKAMAMGAYCPASGVGPGGEWRWEGDDNKMTVWRGEKECCSFSPPLAGAANRDNLLTAIAAADACGAAAERAEEWLRDFLPPLRRMQKIADGDAVVYDDFAHHPTAYRRTLEAAAAANPGRRLVAVFEPRSNTMKAGVFADELAESLSAAARVIAVGDYAWLPKSLSPLGARAAVVADADAAAALLKKETRKNDAIVLMSNGDFGGLPQAAAKIAADISSE